MQVYVAELHVHTVLSPCAEVEMVPPFIVQEAQEQRLTTGGAVAGGVRRQG